MKMKLSPTMGQGGQKAMTGSIQEMMVCLEDAVVTEEQSERTQKQAEAQRRRVRGGSCVTPIQEPSAKASVLFTGHLGRK